MKQMPCPLNGLRNMSEFAYGGEVRPALDPAAASQEDWATHLFLPRNPAGPVREWWLHVPTGYWFIAERDTVTDRILATYPAAELDRHP